MSHFTKVKSIFREKREAKIDDAGSVVQMAKNAASAGARWAKGGFPLASREDYKARRLACIACEKWKPMARLGLGKCTAKGCGCTLLKARLQTEKCPLGKWPKPVDGSPLLKP